jgi:hypothetical protein
MMMKAERKRERKRERSGNYGKGPSRNPQESLSLVGFVFVFFGRKKQKREKI